MNMKGCSMQVYWIHNEEHTDPYTQGYIGISSNVSKRLQQHNKWHCENKNLKEYYANGTGDFSEYEMEVLSDKKATMEELYFLNVWREMNSRLK